MNKTKIEWTDFTWNPVTGCLHGCPYCYARGTAKRFYSPEIGFAPHFWPERIGEPKRRRKPAKIFVTSMGDLFGDWVPENWWRAVFDVVRECPHHTFQCLTKNPRRLKELNPWPENCWVGVTATNQAMFDEAVHHLKDVEVGIKFVSAEPLLGPVRMEEAPGLNWLIIGAQTDRRAKQPMNAWVDDLVADARRWGTNIFSKGNLDGYYIREWPACSRRSESRRLAGDGEGKGQGFLLPGPRGDDRSGNCQAEIHAGLHEDILAPQDTQHVSSFPRQMGLLDYE